jgi:hypothetical protein
MRRAAITLVSTAVLAVTLTACGSSGDSVNTQPKSTAPTSPPATTTTPAATPTTTKPAPAGVGDTITIHGSDDGSKLDVTLVKIDKTAKGGEFDQLDKPTDRWVAVQFRITNTGTAVYSDDPINSVQLADADGQQFEPTYVDSTDGQTMASDVRLTTGKKALGWITFEVPKASKLDSIQFTMDSGFADEAAEWQLS